jgi:alanyl-tRNA synthetase
MTSRDLINKYLNFFENRGHKIIPSAPLVPENDASVLFTTAGMHPLVPFLLGEMHPAGKRLTDNQLCLRTDDIDNVGDPVHHTFFEMLGNWSLGDYWKEESISWSLEFLTKELNIDDKKIWITCFEGDSDAPRDEETFLIWKKIGIPEERIKFLPKKDNWWGPVGETGPCGPDTEIFFDTGTEPCSKDCKPGDNCGRFVEIWNNVFMQYNKTADGKFEALKQRNVDTGMGVDRTTAVVNGFDDDYLVKDLWGEIINEIEEISGKKYEDNKRSFRIIADHIRAATFLIAEGVPAMSNDRHGSILRRLIDRTLDEGRKLNIVEKYLPQLAQVVISSYKNRYPLLDRKSVDMLNTFSSVESRVEEIISTPSQEAPVEEIQDLASFSDDDVLNKMRPGYEKLFDKQTFVKYITDNHYSSLPSVYAGTLAFDAKTTEGRPVSFIEESAKKYYPGFKVNEFYKSLNNYFEQHKKISREAGEKLFKGGLADNSDDAIKYHTATHLLHASLRKILGESVSQKGSNITSERLRFDFSYPQKLTDEQVTQVEDLINLQIEKKLQVSFKVMSLDEAVKLGALHFFAEKYGKEVKVYTIGDFSMEVCGGPHVKNTSEIGRVKINRQEKVGAGIVRIYAQFE